MPEKNPEHTRTLLIYVGKRNVKSTKILSQLAISAFLHKALFQAALVGVCGPCNELNTEKVLLFQTTQQRAFDDGKWE